MAVKSDIDIALPAEILELGEMLSAKLSLRRSSPRQVVDQQPNAEQSRLLDEALLNKARKHPMAKTLLGLNRGRNDAELIRLKAVAILGWQTLRLSSETIALGELASASADPTLPPAEALLRARHEIGVMLSEDTIIGVIDTTERNDGPFSKARLPSRLIEWLSGGETSMGHLTVAKLVGTTPSQDKRSDPTAEPRTLTARQILAGIKERVIGLDAQAELLAGRLSLHLSRARLLKAGNDPGTPNECLLIIGPPGSGKTWMCEVAGACCGIPFASVDCSDLSSEGFVGLSISDTVKGLIVATKGNVPRARFGFLALDEFTKKARSVNESPVNSVGVQYEALRMISGQEMQVGGRRGWDRPIRFNTIGTAFALVGHCPGLDVIIKRKMGRSQIGFATSASDQRAHAWLNDALLDFGLIEEILSRVTGTLVISPPSMGTLLASVTAEHGIVNCFNRLLAAHKTTLSLTPSAMLALAEYGMERNYFRGMKKVVSTLAGEIVLGERSGTITIDEADINRAVAKADGNAADLLSQPRPSTVTHHEENNADDHGSLESAPEGIPVNA